MSNLIPLILILSAIQFLPILAQTRQIRPQTLKLNQPFVRKLTAGHIHQYRISLKQGEFMQVRAEQKGIDVVLSIHSVDGNILAEMDSPNGKEGFETLSFIAVKAGIYLVNINRLDQESNPRSGRYEITLIAKRNSTVLDLERIEAEKQFYKNQFYTLHEIKLGMVRDIQSNIERYTALIPAWQKLKDKYVVDLIEKTIAELKQLKQRSAVQESTRAAEEDEGKTPQEAREEKIRAAAMEATKAKDRATQETKRKALELQRKAVEKLPQLIVETGHTYGINSIAFSPDGKFIASGSRDTTVKLWDIATGKELRTFRGHNEMIYSVKFSPDGKKIASVSGDGVVNLWDVTTGQALLTIDEDKEIQWIDIELQIAFSPDGKTLYLKGSRVRKLWSAETGKELITLIIEYDDEWNGIGDIFALSPDWKTIASSDKSNTIKLRRVGAGRSFRNLRGHSKTIQSLSFSLDGRALISTSSDQTVKVWDTATGKEIRTINVPNETIESAILSPDGKILAITSKSGDEIVSDYTTKLWDVATGKELATIQNEDYTFEFAEFSKDGKRIIIFDTKPVDDNEVIRLATMWDTATGEKIASLQGSVVDFLDAHAYSPNKEAVVIFNTDKFGRDIFELWNLKKGEMFAVSGHSSSVRTIVFSPDEKFVASSGEDHTIKLWDVETGKEVKTLKGRTDSVSRVIISPDEKTLALELDSENDIRLWNIDSGHRPTTLHFEDLYNGSAGEDGSSGFFSPDGKIFVSSTSIPSKIEGSEDGYTFHTGIKLWDVATGQELKFLNGLIEKIKTITFSPDGKILAWAGEDSAIRLWDIATLREVRKITVDGDAESFSFSSNGKMIAHSLPKGITLYDVQTGQKLRTLHGIESPYGFSPDDKILVTINRDEEQVGWEIKLIDVASGKIIRTMDRIAPLSEIGSAIFNSIAFSPDGKTMATFSEEFVATADGVLSPSENFNKRIKLWDVASGRKLRSFDFDDPSTARQVSAIVPDIYWNNNYEPILLDGKLQIKPTENGKLSFYQVKTGKLLADLIVIDENDWMVVTPDGRFDTNNLDNPQGLHWLLPDAPFTPLSFEAFMRDYYEPKLLPRLLRCSEEGDCDKEFSKLPNIGDLNIVQPDVKISGISAPDVNGKVKVTVEVGRAVMPAGDCKMKKCETEVFDVRLFRDSQLVGTFPIEGQEKLISQRDYEINDIIRRKELWRQATRVSLDAATGRKTLTFDVQLPKNKDASQVEFAAYAFNEDRVKSKMATMLYDSPPSQSVVKGRAYIITIGVNANQIEQFNLRYSANDARSLQNALVQRVPKDNYEDVIEIPLVSEYRKDENGKVMLAENNATKSNIKAVLDLLSGKREKVLADALKLIPNAERLKKAQPEDLILLAFSGHGYADQNGIFYLVPYDTGTLGNGFASILSNCISSDELSLWMRDVDARDLLMIIDACHSAAAIQGKEFKPGPMGSRGLGQLAYDKGMRILTATQADDVAYGSGVLKQGLLTYVLVKEGLESGKADFKPIDRKITVSEWLEYGEQGVPKLLEEATKQAKESDAPMELKTLVQKTLSDIKTQRPSLFDFSRKRPEVLLIRE